MHGAVSAKIAVLQESVAAWQSAEQRMVSLPAEVAGLIGTLLRAADAPPIVLGRDGKLSLSMTRLPGRCAGCFKGIYLDHNSRYCARCKLGQPMCDACNEGLPPHFRCLWCSAEPRRCTVLATGSIWHDTATLHESIFSDDKNDNVFLYCKSSGVPTLEIKEVCRGMIQVPCMPRPIDAILQSMPGYETPDLVHIFMPADGDNKLSKLAHQAEEMGIRTIMHKDTERYTRGVRCLVKRTKIKQSVN